MKLDSSMDTAYRQFKLANGEEVLCEIIQWSDEEESAIIIRKAMRIYQVEHSEGYRMYTLRPWMMYSEDPDQLMTINDTQIIGECEPAPTLMKQYIMVVKEYANTFAEELKKMADEDKPFPHNMSDEKLEALMQDIADGDSSNVINMFNVDRSKMH